MDPTYRMQTPIPPAAGSNGNWKFSDDPSLELSLKSSSWR